MITLGQNINVFKEKLAHLFDENELKRVIEITFKHFLKLNSTDFLLERDKALSEAEVQRLKEVLESLKKERPLAYIIGEWEFYGLPFKVNENVLIPRPETEELVKLILNENKWTVSVLDIGTGSGCIPIALKKNNDLFDVNACDISKRALEIATQNSELNGVEVDFFEMDILISKDKKLPQAFDLIVSNPPYITNNEKQFMSNNVLKYEPSLALFVDDNKPLLFYNAIADFAKLNLNNNGKLYFEINENFGNETKTLMLDKGFTDVEIIKDINGKDRIVKASLIN